MLSAPKPEAWAPHDRALLVTVPTATRSEGPCSIQIFSALENVLRTGAMAMLCTTETQIEEIWKKEKPEAQAEAKGNIEKQHPKKSIQCNNAVIWLQIHRRNQSAIRQYSKALLVFSSWGSAQLELQFPFLLLSRASPPFVSYDMDHLRLYVLGGPWPLTSRCRWNGH